MTLGRGWRRAVRVESPEREVDEEIAFHLAMREEALRQQGLAGDRARAESLRRFGDAAGVRAACLTIDHAARREVHVMEWLASVRADVRFALRGMRRSPAFTALAVLTLALGIGATAAIFSLVDGILLRPLPYPDAGRLVQLLQAYPERGLDRWPLSQENVATYRDGVHELAGFAAYTRRQLTYVNHGHPERLSVVRATGDFFTVLGVHPALGRVFGRAEDTPGATDVAVLSHGFWQTHFAADPRVLGRIIDLDGRPTTVIGVMPAGFAFPRPDAQAWLPLGLDPSRRFGWFLAGIGRLAPGATVDQVRRSSTALMWDWTLRVPGLLAAGANPRDTRMTTLVTPLREAITGDSRHPLEVLQAAVLLILLIAAANVATLLGSRTAARAREVALRNALGATRTRVVRQLLTESVALAALGGAAGTALAWALVRAFTRSGAVTLPRLGEVSLSWRVLAVTAVLSAAAGLAFGLMPALGLVRGGLAARLAQGGRGSAHAPARRANRALVMLQLALSVLLLVSAGLVLRSCQRLLDVDLGFQPANVTTIALPLPAAKYTESSAIAGAAARIVADVRETPGVRSAAVAWSFPFSGNVNTDGFIVEGHAPPPGATFETQTVQVAVGPGYFRTLRLPLIHGRDFTSADREGTLPVVIVDEALAQRYWSDAEALGKHMRLTGDTTWFTIVGVAGSVRDQDPATPPGPHAYFPFAQVPDNRPMLAVRTDGNATPVLAAIRREIAALEPGIPLDNVRPLGSWISDTLETRRITELLLGSFALLAALLASVGIYGVMSLWVANRRRELGVRLAVGGEPRHLLALVMGEGLRLAIGGVVLGIAAALVATPWLRALLFQVSPTDPAVYVTLALALLAVAAASCYLPARRAMRSDPMAALRAE